MWTSSSISQAQENQSSVLVYNVENLFDVDGRARYNDYLPSDRFGNEQYTAADLQTKLKHIVQVFERVDNGAGPDVAVLSELEADISPTHYTDKTDEQAPLFLKRYAGLSYMEMLSPPMADSIRTLPSEWWLLKALADAGFDDYQLAVGYNPRDAQGNPENVQKNIILTRLPIQREKTRIHPLHRARPILEVWLRDGEKEFVVFANHWKSGASSKKMEAIRVRNAEVLRRRIEELMKQDAQTDFLLAGDFNSQYNQNQLYNMKKTGLNDVLKSTGQLERVMDNSHTVNEQPVYNLWYQLPEDKRGSDTYRGQWGTLMQVMVSPGMLNTENWYYVPGSFKRIQVAGWNAYETSGVPRRWSSHRSGFGYSDHLPLVLYLSSQPLEKSPNLDWEQYHHYSKGKQRSVQFKKPNDYYTLQDIQQIENIRTEDRFYDQYFYLPIQLTEDEQLLVKGRTYKPYGPGFDLVEELKQAEGGYFYGRLLKYRSTWEFIIETPEFIEPQKNE
jgi:endonuclease/exonuclease/phosphatase family metal-dependent hydrolase